MNSKFIWYVGGILTAVAIAFAILASISAGNTERGSGRKSQPEQTTILLAKARGETQPSEPKGDRSPDPGSGRKD